ncbi:MAG: transaldolase [Ignavibacteriaceae bacterium]|nr:transaldolase [Ignavibacterium sp.]MCC6253909.1 transaldolase [Ignavibacteriaceae bacterium]HRN26760.1 transaldolase [Ignavibacteriaceae bacterium]HRP92679.1 transaldolase [Ignavibacteriaceae bacterium]HRQ55765.1 transaldolase [Ignavibacteriaceae bacterium]
MNNLKKIHDLGQSIWLDFFNREIMDNGMLQKLIDEDSLSGITSNPSIFESAVVSSPDYDDDIKRLSGEQKSNEEIFFEFAISDIKRAADILKPVYEKSNGRDGLVSMEVSPLLANDTEGSIKQARELWKAINRKNAMIKIPGTKEGLPAIRKCISEGININITLLFGLNRYREVTEAYLSGLEDRLKAKQPIDHITSVASFFLSRIDVLLDPVLKEKKLDKLVGEVAIASAKEAYQIYREVFESERFKKLEKQGAKKQKVLWASTGTKDPAYSDVKYVEPLIGPDTINTLPLKTIDAFRDHGKAASSLENNLSHARQVLQPLKDNGISIDEVTQQLEEEGVEKFNEAYNKLLNAIDAKKGESVFIK